MGPVADVVHTYDCPVYRVNMRVGLPRTILPKRLPIFPVVARAGVDARELRHGEENGRHLDEIAWAL